MSYFMSTENISEAFRENIAKVNSSNISNLSHKKHIDCISAANHSSLLQKVDDFLTVDVIINAPDAIIVTGNDSVIMFANKKAEILFGYLLEEMIGLRVTKVLLHKDSVDNSKSLHSLTCEACERSHLQERSFVGVKKNGERIAVEVSLQEYVSSNAPVLIYWIKDAAAAVRQTRKITELEREIAFLSQHSVLGELATAITHELCQPLTAISNYIAAASRSWTQMEFPNNEHGVELVTKAGEQAKRALLTTQRLRRLIQHRSAECVDEDLRVALKEALELATLGASQYGIAIDIDTPSEPVIVNMDSVQIQILLANLIRNAIDELRVWKGERKIWITLKKRDLTSAEVTVQDTGPGIAPDVFESIFDPFLTTKPEGLGVGLAVSRRIAKMHGGRLLAENRPQGGAVFSFVVPVSMSEKVKNE